MQGWSGVCGAPIRFEEVCIAGLDADDLEVILKNNRASAEGHPSAR